VPSSTFHVSWPIQATKIWPPPVSRRRFWLLLLHARQLEVAISCIFYLMNAGGPQSTKFIPLQSPSKFSFDEMARVEDLPHHHRGRAH
jgi:hypothetical protein